jgi:hypothetical protein
VTRVRPSGRGERYRISVIGPGVTPDVVWEGAGLPDYDQSNPAHVAREQETNLALEQVAGAAVLCHAG